MNIRVGVEWVNNFPLKVSRNQEPVSECQNPNLQFEDDLAWGFYLAMGMAGHEQVFAWGDDNAWADDFKHPDFGGDSVNWSDNVHFCYLATHGGQWEREDLRNKLHVAFASQHQFCASSSDHWRLGVRNLKWFVLDSCDLVVNTDPNHIVATWGGPMQGVHLLFGFVGIGNIGQLEAGRGFAFGNAAANRKPLANAWLESAYTWRNDNQTNRPIAIAAGVSREDAINRRENETLDYRDINIPSTNWLAWKWRA